MGGYVLFIVRIQ